MWNIFQRNSIPVQAVSQMAEALRDVASGGRKERLAVDGAVGSLAELFDAANKLIDAHVARPKGLSAERLREVTSVVERFTAGDFEARVLGIDEQSADRQFLVAINRLLDLCDAFVREAGAAMLHVGKDQFFRRMFLTGMGGRFLREAQAINEITAKMGQRYAELREARAKHLEFAEEMRALSELLGSSSTQIEASTSSLADAAEGARVARDLVHAADEVMGAVSRSTDIANQAVESARRASDVVAGLTASITKIGEVTDLIGTITRQTNLLALNAAVEAARAGEAGRGFAVVASEVKSLADQSAEATRGIYRQIQSIQSVTQEAATAMKEVAEIIEQANVVSRTVEQRVAEQKATTTQIASTVNKVTSSADRLKTAVTDVGHRLVNMSQSLVQKAAEIVEEAERHDH